ncbi:DUF6445 family protein [Sphingomonas sp. PAMC 26621]|uniref:DUF6445 family protein n=1 Tax=Sphingomonas sp. PAMC 26621 TaxID=1112213 RepID=UPI001EE674E8|nr:DUF6445 family protein [Sphingomonas sp. PAMC 26621]
MSAPSITVHHVGREAQPVVVIDDFAPDPDALRAAALRTTFGPAVQHYPGLRSALPDTYVPTQLAVLALVLGPLLGRAGTVDVLDASFSMVTTPPEALEIRQRIPHCDAFGPERIALVHYLAPEGGDGTAFFRHRSTGFETIDADRAPIFFGQLDAEFRFGGVPPARYVLGDTSLFERTLAVEARYNRALVYPSYLLHSGAIAPDAVLSSDPALGRLTVTAFLSVG